MPRLGDERKRSAKVTDASTISRSDTVSWRSFQVQRLNFSNKPDHDTLFVCLIPDIFVDDTGDSIAILEIKATDWDHIKPQNIQRNIYRHQKQLFDYVYKYYFVDERFATYGIIYPAPTEEGRFKSNYRGDQ